MSSQEHILSSSPESRSLISSFVSTLLPHHRCSAVGQLLVSFFSSPLPSRYSSSPLPDVATSSCRLYSTLPLPYVASTLQLFLSTLRRHFVVSALRYRFHVISLSSLLYVISPSHFRHFFVIGLRKDDNLLSTLSLSSSLYQSRPLFNPALSAISTTAWHRTLILQHLHIKAVAVKLSPHSNVAFEVFCPFPLPSPRPHADLSSSSRDILTLKELHANKHTGTASSG